MGRCAGCHHYQNMESTYAKGFEGRSATADTTNGIDLDWDWARVIGQLHCKIYLFRPAANFKQYAAQMQKSIFP